MKESMFNSVQAGDDMQDFKAETEKLGGGIQAYGFANRLRAIHMCHTKSGN